MRIKGDYVLTLMHAGSLIGGCVGYKETKNPWTTGAMTAIGGLNGALVGLTIRSFSVIKYHQVTRLFAVTTAAISYVNLSVLGNLHKKP